MYKLHLPSQTVGDWYFVFDYLPDLIAYLHGHIGPLACIEHARYGYVVISEGRLCGLVTICDSEEGENG